MGLELASPFGALIAAAGLLPATGLLAARARARGVRRTLGLPEPARGSRLLLVALAALVACIAAAAAQPVLRTTATRLVRTDAEAYVILDTSRSMLARRDPGSPQRLTRAKAAAALVRDALPSVPVGIASLTDRVLPHLFPTVREDVFRATLERAVGIERPPPRSGFLTNVSRLDALATLPELNFFAPTARRRLVVVVTDGESLPFNAARVAARLRGPPPIDTILVQVWDGRERVFTRGVPEREYRPDRAARSSLDGLAAATDGSVFSEGDAGSAAARAREVLGEGPTAPEGERRERLALAPYLAGAAFLPLAFLLWRRDR